MRAGCRRRTRREGRRQGFSLIELLVVLAVIALIAAVVPRIILGLPGIRLRSAADGMVATLKELHDQAIRRGMTTELILDPAARVYRISPDPRGHALPQVVSKVRFKSVMAVQPRGAASTSIARVRFFADGSATGGSFLLYHGKHLAVVTVDWLTGRIYEHG